MDIIDAFVECGVLEFRNSSQHQGATSTKETAATINTKDGSSGIRGGHVDAIDALLSVVFWSLGKAASTKEHAIEETAKAAASTEKQAAKAEMAEEAHR